MKNYNISAYISNYLLEHNISASEIEKETNIPEEKLLGKAVLTAGEFLDLCCYLNISPDKIIEENQEK